MIDYRLAQTETLHHSPLIYTGVVKSAKFDLKSLRGPLPFKWSNMSES